MQRAPFRLLVSLGTMTEKDYSVFPCVLLISVLFFPLTTAGRVLLDTPQNEDGNGNHGNGGNKMEVQPRKSNPAHPATGLSSPAHATPCWKPANNAAAGDESGYHLYAGNKIVIKPSHSSPASSAHATHTTERKHPSRGT